jgi:Family of unknown function (DUF6328)
VNDQDRTDRQMAELLQELRIALPGVQILFAFLLAVPFAPGFQDVTSFQRTMFFIALLATAASAVCMIAVPATHRLRFQQRDRPYIIESSNRFLIAGLVALAVAIIAAPFALVVFAAWLGRRLYRRREEDRLLAT